MPAPSESKTEQTTTEQSVSEQTTLEEQFKNSVAELDNLTNALKVARQNVQKLQRSYNLALKTASKRKPKTKKVKAENSTDAPTESK